MSDTVRFRVSPNNRSGGSPRTPRRWARLWLALGLVGLIATACGAPSGRSSGSEVEDTTAAPATTSVPETTSTATPESGQVAGENDAGLIAAAGRGDAQAVKRLLDQGASVRARDQNGQTALIAAAYGNHLEAAETLIEAGADVNAQDETRQSAYLISTSEVGDDPRLLELTLRNDADVRSLDSYNGTGLIRAAERGYAEVVGELLKTDIDVDHVNNLGWTALLEAIVLGDGGPPHTETVRLLVGAGADVNLPDGEGVTPLAHARQRSFTEIAEILQSAGAR